MNILTRPDENSEFYTDEKCHILELLHSNSSKPFSLARARVEPGVTTLWHSLKNTEEHYVIISGQGIMEIDHSQSYAVTKGDIITIPANIPQRITNTSDNNDLVFYAICSPAFNKENYTDLEFQS